MDYLEVMFSCRGCSLKKHKMRVRLRSPNEDIRHYMEHVQAEVGFRHRFMSPGCSATTCDLLIPYSKDDPSKGIGVVGKDIGKIPEQFDKEMS